MKTGKSVVELATEIQRQSKAKKDYLAPLSTVTVTPQAEVVVKDIGTFGMNDHFQGQMAGYLDYPIAFFKRSRDEHRQQWSDLVNAMLQSKPREDRMIRTLDGNGRAFLSNRYRPIDNEDLAEVVLNMVYERRNQSDPTDTYGWTVAAGEITETKLYIKILTPMVKALKVGDIVQSGLIVSNSEVGAGALTIDRLLYRLVCKNGMIMPDSGMRKHHLGSALSSGGNDNVRELFSGETLRQSDKALLMQTRDVMRSVMNEKHFGALVDRFAATIGQKIEGDVPKAVEVLGKRVGLTEAEGKSVLDLLIKQGDGLDRFGIVNAITATAKRDDVNFDRAVELERIGSEVIDLPQSAWKLIAEAKADDKN